MGFFGLFKKKKDKEEKLVVDGIPEDISMDDVKKILKITDRLLQDLPAEEIDEFSKSKEFRLYKVIISKLVPEANIQEEEAEKFRKEHIDEIAKIVDQRILEYNKKKEEKKKEAIAMRPKVLNVPTPISQPQAQTQTLQQPQSQIQRPASMPVQREEIAKPQFQQQQSQVASKPISSAQSSSQSTAQMRSSSPIKPMVQNQQNTMSTAQKTPTTNTATNIATNTAPKSATPKIDMAAIKANIEAKIRSGK